MTSCGSVWEATVSDGLEEAPYYLLNVLKLVDKRTSPG